MSDFSLFAKNILKKYFDADDDLEPLYIQPDRQVFLAPKLKVVLKIYVEGDALKREFDATQKAAEAGVPTATILRFEQGSPSVLLLKYVSGESISSKKPLAAKEVGKYLEQFHQIGATAPFSGGQYNWHEFVSWWANQEISNVKKLGIFDEKTVSLIEQKFQDDSSLLFSRPVVLLHGDLQAVHVLVDQKKDEFLAFLDFADTQPGDPLLDIAVLSLHDVALASYILEGYQRIENDDEVRRILSLYRLLRRLAEIPWLLNRNLRERAEEDRLEILREFS